MADETFKTALARWKAREAAGETQKMHRLSDVLSEPKPPTPKSFTVPLKVGKNTIPKPLPLPATAKLYITAADGSVLASGLARRNGAVWSSIEPLAVTRTGVTHKWMVSADAVVLAHGLIGSPSLVDPGDVITADCSSAVVVDPVVPPPVFADVEDLSDAAATLDALDAAAFGEVTGKFTGSFAPSLYGKPSKSLMYGGGGVDWPWPTIGSDLTVDRVNPATCSHAAWSYPEDRCPSCGITAKALAASGRKSRKADAAENRAPEPAYVPGKRAVRLDE